MFLFHFIEDRVRRWWGVPWQGFFRASTVQCAWKSTEGVCAPRWGSLPRVSGGFGPADVRPLHKNVVSGKERGETFHRPLAPRQRGRRLTFLAHQDMKMFPRHGERDRNRPTRDMKNLNVSSLCFVAETFLYPTNSQVLFGFDPDLLLLLLLYPPRHPAASSTPWWRALKSPKTRKFPHLIREPDNKSELQTRMIKADVTSQKLKSASYPHNWWQTSRVIKRVQVITLLIKKINKLFLSHKLKEVISKLIVYVLETAYQQY